MQAARNIVDVVLAAYLVVVFPALQLRASLTGRLRQERSQSQRLQRALLLVGAPLAVLLANWLLNSRTFASLGLGNPLSVQGKIGLLVGCAAIVALFASDLFFKRTPQQNAELRSRLSDAGLIAAKPDDLVYSVVLALLTGCGTEILFRGFLYGFFAPLIGPIGAVIVAALAYGLGHGFRTIGQAVGSVVSAFAFTIAFALTGSLWWLMLVHTAVGLSGIWWGYRLASSRV